MGCDILEIKAEHDLGICKIIQTVGKEFGAIGEGFGPSDPEVAAMSRHYSDEQLSRYLIAMINGHIAGGGGVAAFNGSETICELRKLFLLPEYRGSGIGRELTLQCLKYATSKGYKRCYLDTLSGMTSAIALYEKLEFVHLKQALDATIHTGCDVWMIKELQ